MILQDSSFTQEELDRIKKVQASAERGYDLGSLKRLGRPPLDPESPSVVVTVRVSAAVAAALDERCTALNQSRSEVARHILEKDLIVA